MLYSFKRSLKLPTISATSAFMGATYTILNALVSTVPIRAQVQAHLQHQ